MPLAFAAPLAAALSGSRSTLARHTKKRCNTRRPLRMCDIPNSTRNGVPLMALRYEGVSWNQVEMMCKKVATEAKPHQFDVILAVTRGGLVPATLLCEQLELRNVLSATVMFYTDGGEQFFGMTEPRFLSFPNNDALEGRKVLIVDDVWDTGRTANAVRKRAGRANPKLLKVAVLHFKPDMNDCPGEEPDFYASTTNKWVVYPWERPSPQAPEVGDGLVEENLQSQSYDSEGVVKGTG